VAKEIDPIETGEIIDYDKNIFEFCLAGWRDLQNIDVKILEWSVGCRKGI
jgi:hypothetical protein